MNALSLFFGVLIGLVILIIVYTSIKIFKLFCAKPEDDPRSNQDQIKEPIIPFIDTSQGISIDAEDLNSGNELIAMKYKLEMFKLRNKFYKDDFV